MMKKTNLAFAFATGVMIMACSDKKQTTETQSTNLKETVQAEYPEIPREEILEDDTLSTKVYNELKTRYKKQLVELQKAVSSNGAQLVITFLSPEVGESLTKSNRLGKELIEGYAKELQVPFYDLTQKLANQDPKVVTQLPKDGHWSKEGAKIIAEELTPIIKQFSAVKSTKTFAEKPETFGDLFPSNDEILDGGKGLPYRVKTNAQGLRMDTDVSSTKTKQRILFLGDSEMYFPFLDNKNIGTNLLQTAFPDKEMLNTANWGYSIDDYVSLYKEKAQFAEPDVVILTVNGNDFLDMYFSHRNRFSRNKQPQNPSEVEKSFYQKHFSK